MTHFKFPLSTHHHGIKFSRAGNRNDRQAAAISGHLLPDLAGDVRSEAIGQQQRRLLHPPEPDELQPVTNDISINNDIIVIL